MSDKVDYFGRKVCLLNVSELINDINESVVQRRQLAVSYINFHTTNIMQVTPSPSDVFNSFDIVMPDGIASKKALQIMGKIKAGDSILLHLETWIPALYSTAVKQRWGVYLLGGDGEIAARSAENLKQSYPGIKVVGTYHGHFSIGDESQKVINSINQSDAVILLVGMGQPKQEEWIISNKRQLNALVIIAVGGYFDKVCKMANAYPKWAYKYGLLWLYRLLKEPRRLWKRYSFGIVVFGLRVLRLKLGLIFSPKNLG
jgi:N-acetylglucosaminyldiphosphoundecaprenol N-acetyl-beta-D-mannosaminyltransferase